MLGIVDGSLYIDLKIALELSDFLRQYEEG